MYQLPMPAFLADIYAKSQDRGGETLAQHTGDVLGMLARLRDLRPDLPALTQMPKLWRTLYWACLFHDSAKPHVASSTCFRRKSAGTNAMRCSR